MHFYYDPIIGLVYSIFNTVILDIEYLPKNNISFDEAMHLWRNMGIKLGNSNEPSFEIDIALLPDELDKFPLA